MSRPSKADVGKIDLGAHSKQSEELAHGYRARTASSNGQTSVLAQSGFTPVGMGRPAGRSIPGHGTKGVPAMPFALTSSQSAGVFSRPPSANKGGGSTPIKGGEQGPVREKLQEVMETGGNGSFRIELRAPTFTGPLSTFNTFVSNKSTHECLESLKNILTACVDAGISDFEANQDDFTFSGRMYRKDAMSEFRLSVYESGESSFVAIIELTRMSGDSFVHEDIHTRVLDGLAEMGVVEKKQEEEQLNLFLDDDDGASSGSGMALSELSAVPLVDLKSIPDFPAPMGLGMPLSMDGMESDLESLSLTGGHSDRELVNEHVQVVLNRDSYREDYRESSAFLAIHVDESDEYVRLVGEIDGIVKGLMMPLLDGFYDTLIVKNILSVVHKLIANEYPTYGSVREDLISLKDMWTKGVTQEMGPMSIRFIPSQQVQRVCQSCLDCLS